MDHKYKWTHAEPMGRSKYMPKHDTNNNHNVENMNNVMATEHQQQKEEKRPGSGRSFQFDKFNQSQQNYESSSYVNHQQPPQTQPQQMQQQSNTNTNNSKFMSFFANEGNSSSSSLNEFFKQAINQGHGNNPEQPKSLGHIGQMPSVDQLEAKWRRNSLNNVGETANKQTDNFQKLIGSLSSAKPQSQAVGYDAISNFIMQQQQYQQQQQKQHLIIQQQQQRTAFLASLQLKAILGRADTQLLLLRLTKGDDWMMKTKLVPCFQYDSLVCLLPRGNIQARIAGAVGQPTLDGHGSRGHHCCIAVHQHPAAAAAAQAAAGHALKHGHRQPVAESPQLGHCPADSCSQAAAAA